MGSVQSGYGKFTKLVDLIVRWLCIGFFSVMVVDVIMSVIMRYILVKPMVWGEQLAIYCMIWIAFLASSTAFRKGAHMGLDLLLKVAPPRARRVIEAIAHLLVLLFLLVLTVWGFKHAYAVRQQRSPVVFNMSMFWAYLALPVGGVCMLIQEIEVIVNGAEEDV